MHYKVKWRVPGESPLAPELLPSAEDAKARARELLLKYGRQATVEIWNEAETWQVVGPAGIAEWCAADPAGA